jgi:hypothetical protein
MSLNGKKSKCENVPIKMNEYRKTKILLYPLFVWTVVAKLSLAEIDMWRKHLQTCYEIAI